MANPETRIEDQFVNWCKDMGLYCPKLVFRVGRGWPDRSVMLPGGRVVWIEFKTATGESSPQQKEVARRLANSGHTVYVCRSSDEAIKIVENML
jgi:hypothetical protein